MPNRKPSSKRFTAARMPRQKKDDQPAPYFNQRTLKRMLKLVLILMLTLYFSVAAVVFILRYAVLPNLKLWQPRIEQIASRALHAQVSIGTLQGSWQGLQTNLTLTTLSILDQQGQPALVVPRATATLSWRSLLLLRPVLSNLSIEAPMIRVDRARDGTLSVAGISSAAQNQEQNRLLSWVLAQEAIVLRNGTVHWHDATGTTPPVTITQLRFSMVNYQQQHRLGLQAEVKGGPSAGPLDIRARFRHGRLSRIDNIADWKGTVYLRTNAIDLPTLNRSLKLPIVASSGKVDAHTWFRFSQGQIQGLSGNLAVRDLVLRAAPDLPILNLPKLSLAYHAQYIENELSLRIRDISMQLGGSLASSTQLPSEQTFKAQRLHARYRPATVRHGRNLSEHFSIEGDVLDIGLFAKLAHALPLPPSVITSLDRFKPKGILRGYAFEGEFAVPSSPSSQTLPPSLQPFVRYRVAADFEDASLKALPATTQSDAANHALSGLPGFTHLSGSINASERRGLLKLDAQAASITLPDWLDEPKLIFDSLRGEASWMIKKTGSSSTLNAQFKSLAFANADAAGTLEATYHQNGSHLGELNLQTHFNRATIKRIPHYLPTSLSKSLRTYLSHALIGGTAHNATLQIEGPLDAFPFQPKKLCLSSEAKNADADSALGVTPGAVLCQDSTQKPPGIFRIYAPFTNGSFNPSPPPTLRNVSGIRAEWPSFEGINGVFEIDQNALKFHVEQAHYRDISLTRIHGLISDLAKSTELILEGQASGPLNDLLHYLRQTPIPRWVGLPADKWQAQKNATLDLRLRIPLDGSPHIGVTGTVELLNNSLSLNTLPPLNMLSGKLKFTEQSLSFEQISAQWLGGNLKLAGTVALNDKTKLEASGQLSTRDLYSYLAQNHRTSPLATITRRLDGNAPYTLNIEAQKNSPATIQAQANLRTVSIDLPAPLAKTAHQPMLLRFTLKPISSAILANTTPSSLSASKVSTPSSVSSSPASPSSLLSSNLSQLEFQLGSLTAIYLQRAGPQPTVVSGALSFNRPAVLPTHGVVASAHFKQFDLDAWQAFANELMASAAVAAKQAAQGSGPSSTLFSTSSATSSVTLNAGYLPTSFALHFNTLTFADRRWPNFNLKAWHDHQAWHAQLAAPNLAGRVLWLPASTQREPTRTETLSAHLTRLAIPTPIHPNKSSNRLQTDADNNSSLNLKIDALSLHNQDLGSLEMALRKMITTQGLTNWQLDKLQLTHPSAQLEAKGSWQTLPNPLPAESQPEVQRAAVDFKLGLNNAGMLLKRFGLPNAIRDGHGNLEGNLSWRGKLMPIDYTTLTGALSLNLQRGQIVQVEPKLGKLVGILSLQSLAHFLTLDFRELTNTGLTFERMTASAKIDRGIVRTEDFSIASSLAQINVKGSADLVQEQQNLRVDVKPALSAGSAVLAAAFVNPLWGIGSYLAQEMLSASVSRTLAAQYRVCGSWNNPQIERIPTQDNKVAVTSCSFSKNLSTNCLKDRDSRSCHILGGARNPQVH